MKRFIKSIVFMLSLLVLMPAAGAQEATPEYAQLQYAPEQLDRLLAPIALYPDPLLSQILMASTYPLEVVEASRWLQNPQNARLHGDQLAAVLEQQPWAPSVKSLTSAPQVLALLNNNLQWMEQLGNAFLAQESTVMDSVQRLRQMALNAGNLASSPQQIVAGDNGDITITPANPQTVYVPAYSPYLTYGTWPYPDQPYYFPPPPGYYYDTGAIVYWTYFPVAEWLWGWNRWDWQRHRIDLDDRRYAALNRGDPPRVSGEWTHEGEHRHGVPYANPVIREQYQGTNDQLRRNYRGYAQAPAPAGVDVIHPNAIMQSGARNAPAPAGVDTIHPNTIMQSGVRNAPAPAEVDTIHPNAIMQQSVQHPIASERFEGLEHHSQNGAPMFESFAHGSETHAHSERGAASRSVPAVPNSPQPSPAQSPPPANGGHVFGH